MLHFARTKIVQERSPLLVFFQIFGDVFGEKNVVGVPATHYPFGHVDPSAREIGPFVYIHNPADGSAVDSIPNWKPMLSLYLRPASDLDFDGRYRAGVEANAHPSPGRIANQGVGNSAP